MIILLAASSSAESSINIVEALSSDEITAGPYLSKFFPIEREIYPKHEKISGFISNGASGFYFIINNNNFINIKEIHTCNTLKKYCIVFSQNTPLSCV